MTCIVGLVDRGKVWIGGDTGASMLDGSQRQSWKNSKVFIKENFLFGYAGDFRFGQLLEYAFEPPPKVENQTDLRYLVTTFTDSLITTLQNSKFLLEDKNSLPESNGFLLGYNGVLYEFQEDFAWGIPSSNYSALGSGSPYALGVLHALYGSNQGAKTIITKALTASSVFCGSVLEPFIIESI